MRVRDDGALDRPPGVDVEVAGRAVQAFARAARPGRRGARSSNDRSVAVPRRERGRSASPRRRSRRACDGAAAAAGDRPSSTRSPPFATASSRWPRSSAAKASSRTKTLASRASSRLSGSRFDEPTVASAALRAVEHRHLGVQEARRVLDDLDAGVEHHAVHRPAGVVLHEVLVAALQQQRDLDAAVGRAQQRALQGDAGNEVGVGDQDLALAPGRSRSGRSARCACESARCRAAPGRRAAPARRRRRRGSGRPRSARSRRRRCRRAAASRTACQRGREVERAAPRAPTCRRSQRRVIVSCASATSGPGDAHREVEARLLERAVGRIDVVVEQVDAAAEADRAVDDAELAVQAAPARAAAGRASRAPG